MGVSTMNRRKPAILWIGFPILIGLPFPVFATDFNTLCPALKWDYQYGRDCGYRISTIRFKPIKIAHAYTDTNFTAGTGLLNVGHMNDRYTIVGQAYHRDGKKHAVAIQINEQYSENHYYTDLGLAQLTSSAGAADNHETLVGSAQFVSGGALKPALFRGRGSNYTPNPVTLLGGGTGTFTDAKLGMSLTFGYPMEYRVGWEVLADGRKHGVAWWVDGGAPAAVNQIGPDTATSYALATNASGHAVGGIRESIDPAERAFVWRWDPFAERATLTKLGSLGDAATALDVNNNAVPRIVGFAKESGSTYSFAAMWTGASLTKLANFSGSGNPNAKAYSVTDAGDIVGTSRGKATLWRDGKVYDLNTALTATLNTTLVRAVQINRQGIVVAYGADRNYYMLVPAEHL